MERKTLLTNWKKTEKLKIVLTNWRKKCGAPQRSNIEKLLEKWKNNSFKSELAQGRCLITISQRIMTSANPLSCQQKWKIWIFCCSVFHIIIFDSLREASTPRIG